MVNYLIKCKKCGKEKKTRRTVIRCCGIQQKGIIVLESEENKRQLQKNSENAVKNNAKLDSGVMPFKIIQKPVQIVKTKEMKIKERTIEEQQEFRNFIEEQEKLKQTEEITPEEYRKRVGVYIKEREEYGRTDNRRRIQEDTTRKREVRIIRT